MDTATKLTIEYGKRKPVTVKLSRPFHIVELSDILLRKVGRRPTMLTVSGQTAIATF